MTYVKTNITIPNKYGIWEYSGTQRFIFSVKLIKLEQFTQNKMQHTRKAFFTIVTRQKSILLKNTIDKYEMRDIPSIKLGGLTYNYYLNS